MIPENIFVDTSAWVALADRDDAHHAKASSIYPALLKTQNGLVTSNFVIAESYALLLNEMGRQAAIEFLERIKASPRILKVYSNGEIESEAEKLLRKYSDQNFSYADVVSFVVMKREKIKKAFSFDARFLTVGFLNIP